MMKNKKRLKIELISLSLVFAAIFSGCEPEEIKMNLLVYDNATDSYVFDDVEVKTLDDIGRLEGEATTLVGGSSIKLDYQTNKLVWNDAGHSVAFEWIKKNGVLIPEDYHSLAMASIYYNIELSMLFFFDALGLPQGALNDMRTYYWVDMKIVETDGENYKSKDNAFYMYLTPKEQAFFVVPFDQFQWIPMPLNSGIITHEYSHAVFDSVVYGLKGEAALSSSSVNFLTGINEGCADFFAVARTLDPDYLAHSVPKGLYVIECNYPGVYSELVRDASVPKNYTDLLDTPARDMETFEFCPYDIGSFFESLLYEIAGKIDQDSQGPPSRKSLTTVARWLLGALEDLGNRISSGNQQPFEIWELISNFVMRIGSKEERDAACSVIQTRYEMYFDEVEGC
jgi:hypothetical protein